MIACVQHGLKEAIDVSASSGEQAEDEDYDDEPEYDAAGVDYGAVEAIHRRVPVQ